MQRAQLLAARAVRRVLAGVTLTHALLAVGAGDERALVHELAYGTLRFLGTLRAIVGALARRGLDPEVEALLWVALYQLLHTRAPDHAVVDCAVQATARARRPAAKGLVNAVLRNFLRRRHALVSAIERDPEARFSYPQWWIERVRSEYPDAFARVLDAGNARPPLCLRINARKTDADAFIALLHRHGIAGSHAGSFAVTVDPPRPVAALPGYAEGYFSVQDTAAQLAAPLLGAQRGMRVLDACAAPGGKTTHLAELADLELTALDADGVRMKRLHENLTRLCLEATTIVGDAGDPGSWWDGRAFDRILADVPCTASGVVRRHPDVKWLRRHSDLTSFASQQRRILDALWPLVARGGRLLYSTCSVFRAENADQVDAFLARHHDAVRVGIGLPASFAASEGQILPVEGDAEHNHDGFFYALLQKSS